MPIKPLDFEKFLISEYFKHGSINKVFYFHHFSIPISYAGYDRVLTKYGIIKSAGPNSKLTESLRVLSLVADYKLSLEKIYEKYAPQTIRVSTNTLHRILHYTRLGLTRRQGTALIITCKNQEEILVGNDQSLSNGNLGNKGDISLPMGHSKTGESPRESIIRVLQQEVFTNLVLNQAFPYEVVPEHPKPVLYINIADIRVSVYHLSLVGKYSFSSFKLNRLRFQSIEKISTSRIRPGVEDILKFYLNINTLESDKIPVFNCSLNLNLAKVKNQ